MKVLWDGGLLGCSVKLLTPSLQQAKRKGGGESWAMEKASVERPQPVISGSLAHRSPDACTLMIQGSCAYKSAPGSVDYHVRPAVPAITQPFPWMSLLCYVSNAWEHFWDHEKPSLEAATPWG